MKFLHLDLPKKKMKRYHVAKKKKSVIWKLLKRIQNRNMRKFHTSYCHEAVYRDMLTRCIICSSEKEDLIFRKRFDKMIRRYEAGKVFSPFDFGVEKFNPLAHLLVKYPINEC